MDPITQGVIGATAAQLVAPTDKKRLACIIGIGAGMAADLDVLIRSSSDPLFALEYHRHFTHAIAFIPVGAAVCALIAYAVLSITRFKQNFSTLYIFSLAAYGTHALLDACTTYGTQLFWPFSDQRVAWNIVSVVDPLYTLALIFFCAWTTFKRSNISVVIASIFALTYLGLGWVQQQRAESIASMQAAQRGHQPTRLGLKPSFGNIILWKSIYYRDDQYYVDAVRVLADDWWIGGESTARLNKQVQLPWLRPHSQQSLDLERFRWFSNDHLGLDPNNSLRVIDVRYSLIPNEFGGMWGIVFDPQSSTSEHVAWSTLRPQGTETKVALHRLWQMVWQPPTSESVELRNDEAE